jgi:hypothetical protein
MTTYFVDSRNGDDANTGLDFPNALKTLGAAFLAMSTNDDVTCQGVFKETLVIGTGKINTWNAHEFAIIDGDGVLTFGVQSSGGLSQTQTFNGFIFKNHSLEGIRLGAATTQIYTFNDCVFEDELTGSQAIFSATYNLTRTIVRNCSVGFTNHSTLGENSMYNFLNCTLVNNGTVVDGALLTTGTGKVKAQNSIFSHNTIHIKVDGASAVNAVQEFNNIDFSSGKCVIGVADKLTLAAWQTDVSPADASSISTDPLYVDRLKRLHGLLRTSQSLVAGSIVFGTIVQGAVLKQCEGVSTNRNSSEWTGATLINVIVNGNGDIELDTGQTVGTATIVHDFGSGADIDRLFVEHDNDFPKAALDFDKTDTLPETWEVRVATSDDDITYSAFTTVNLARPSLGIVNKRYVKVEVTLRKDLD